MVIHGRAHKYSEGSLRIWHIGTHHEYQPADEPSGTRLLKWIEAGVSNETKSKSAVPLTSVNLFADFLICPTEPFKKGSVQRAQVKSSSHRRYIHLF